MAKIQSLSAETDKKIRNKEKEIQDIDAKKQKLRKEIAELKKQQERERNDGFGDLLKKQNIDTNQLAHAFKNNPDVFEMIKMMLAEQNSQELEEAETDTAPEEEQTVTEDAEYATVCDDDSDDDFID